MSSLPHSQHYSRPSGADWATTSISPCRRLRSPASRDLARRLWCGARTAREWATDYGRSGASTPVRTGSLVSHRWARQAPAVYSCIGRPELSEDPAFRNLLVNPEMNDLVEALIADWASGLTSAEVFALADEHRAPFSVVPTPRELLDSASLAASNFWVELEHPVIGSHVVPGSAFDLVGTPFAQTRAPLLGEHTDQVLAELPRTEDESDRTNGAPADSPSSPLSRLEFPSRPRSETAARRRALTASTAAAMTRDGCKRTSTAPRFESCGTPGLR